MNNQNNYDFYPDLENRIKNNLFKSKEELTNYIFNLKQRGIIPHDEYYKIEKLLNLYDEMHLHTENALDIKNYKSVSLEEQELIVSTESDRILKTDSNHDEMEKEFKQLQNELAANSQQELVDADDVFKKLADTQKEEVTLLFMSEVFSKDDIDLEILQKIKYFITNRYINPYDYKVDIENGIFYNTLTDEVLEVRKDVETNEYKIFRGDEIVYENNYYSDKNNEYDSQLLEREEDEQIHDKKNIKVRRLTKDNDRFSNAAFSKIGFLILNIIIFIAMFCFVFFIKKIK